MIEIVGLENRPEYDYAERLAESIRAVWPDIDESDDIIRIAAPAKIFGGSVEDVDLVLVACLNNRKSRLLRRIKAQDLDTKESVDFFGDVYINNILVTFELKSHDPRWVRFEGTNVLVHYKNTGWKSASEQSEKQMRTLKKYMQSSADVSSYIAHLIVLDNLTDKELPPRPHNICSGSSQFRSLLTILTEIRPPYLTASGKKAALSFFKHDVADKIVTLPIFNTLEPTRLDRKRMELLARKDPQIDTLATKLGEKHLVLRGHGGAGKTSKLLQLAHRAFDENASKTLFLTYNQALAADIRRLMVIAGIPSTEDFGGIRVETVMTFMGRLFKYFDLISADDDLIEMYDDSVRTLAELLRQEVVTTDEIQQILSKDPEALRYDFVMVDEGQDWPQNEIDIIRLLYGAERTAVADGIDQFVRGVASDWRRNINPELVDVVRLHQCLRMKSNLAKFANFFAEKLGLTSWHVKPFEKASGGRVLVVDGDYFNEVAIHRGIIKDIKSSGNSPIDCLYCVPHTYIKKTTDDRVSLVSEFLKQHGEECWDGVSENVRKEIPWNNGASRVVHYRSCRGLEGWTVACLGLDVFYDFELDQALRDGNEEGVALRTAARWVMIPLTRPMDTLVIHVTRNDGKIYELIQEALRVMPDVVQRIG